MRVFLTGATGVIGRRAIPLLLAAGHRVTAVGRSPSSRRRLSEMGADPVELDLFQPNAVRGAVAGHDAVINLATHIPKTVGAMLLPGAWRENDRIRGIASGIVARSAREARVPLLVQESFAPMYAAAGDRWIDEESPVSPARYNRSALVAERAAADFTRAGGRGVVLRFAAFYGPDALGQAFVSSVRKGWSPLIGSPEGYFSSLEQADAGAAVAAALDAPPGVFNVADDEPLRRREYVNVLAEALGVAPPRFAPAWTARLAGSAGELMSRSERISNAAFRAATGWSPVYPSVREGWPVVIAELQAKARPSEAGRAAESPTRTRTPT
jgi:nucleoside-diphosphate-sugar epimerase